MYTFDKLAAKEVAKKDARGSKALNEYLFLKPHDGTWYEDPRLQAGAGAGLGALGGGLIGKQLGGNTGAIIGAGLGGLAGGYGGYAYGPSATKKLAQVGKKAKEKVGEVSEKAKAKRKEREAKAAAYYGLNQEWFNTFDRLADKKASAQDKIASPVTEQLRSLFAAHPITTGVGLGVLGGGLYNWRTKRPVWKGALTGGLGGGVLGAGAGTIASVPALQYLGKEYGVPIDIGM